jgi:hypothetical protein
VTRYPRWGFWKLFDRLRVEGRSWNHKHVHRVYCALRLNLPRRTTRRVPRRIRQPLTAPPVLNQTWALDFMTETLYDSRRVRLLTVIDEGNREGLGIAMGVSLPSRRVVRVLNELVALHGRAYIAIVMDTCETVNPLSSRSCPCNAALAEISRLVSPGDRRVCTSRSRNRGTPELISARACIDWGLEATLSMQRATI